jgi:hypothetical protein
MQRVVQRLQPAAIAAVLILLAAPYVGMFWQWVAPAPTYVNLSGDVYLDNQDTSAFIAADGWFLVIGLVAGIVSAGLAYWRWRGDVVVIVAMAGAAVVGSLIARQVGEAFGPPSIQQTALTLGDGQTIQGSIKVAANGVLFAWAVGILLTFLSLIGGLERSSEDAEDDAEAEFAEDGNEQAGEYVRPHWAEEFDADLPRNGHPAPGAPEDEGASVGAAGLAGDVGAGQRGQVGEHDPLPAEKGELGA